jgi:hypothetical protein
MKKLFVSQPMNGKSADEIKRARQKGLEVVKVKIGEFELIDTYFEGFNGNRLEFLGKSIMEGLAKADVALFLDDWEKFNGCRSEHFVATQYGVCCIYA